MSLELVIAELGGVLLVLIGGIYAVSQVLSLLGEASVLLM